MDGLGNMRQALSNGSSTLASSFDYSAFGELIGVSGSSSSPYGWGAQSGYRQDSGSGQGDCGLVLMGARWYDPATGRFTSRDSDITQSAYVYCYGDPINLTDPSGHKSQQQNPPPLLPPNSNGSPPSSSNPDDLDQYGINSDSSSSDPDELSQYTLASSSSSDSSSTTSPAPAPTPAPPSPPNFGFGAKSDYTPGKGTINSVGGVFSSGQSSVIFIIRSNGEKVAIYQYGKPVPGL